MSRLEFVAWLTVNVVVATALVVFGYAIARERCQVSLSMREFLITKLLFDEGENEGSNELVSVGFHPKVVMAKAEKAARKGYLEYGSNPWYGWVTDEGREFLNIMGTGETSE